MNVLGLFTPDLSTFNLNWVALILGAVLLFFVCREILTWYWKVNEEVDLLKQIEKNTRKDETAQNR